MVRILYFGGLVDRLGRASEEAELPAGVGDVQGLVGWLRGRGGAWAQALPETAIKVTVNRQVAGPASPLKDGDEIALIGR